MVINLGGCLRVRAEQSQMPINSLNRPEFRIRNQVGLGLTVGWRKKHVAGHGQHKGLCLNTTQCRCQIAARVPADITSLPFPGHAGQVVRVHDPKVTVHEIDDEIVHWRNGEAFIFDDTRKHETWNHTAEDRIILLMHVDRPVRFPGSLIGGLFMLGIRWSPFIGDARRKMKAWDKSFRKMEKGD